MYVYCYFSYITTTTYLYNVIYIQVFNLYPTFWVYPAVLLIYTVKHTKLENVCMDRKCIYKLYNADILESREAAM